MRVLTYILSTALLAGSAAAQTAPASQTVNTNPPQPTKPANTTAKSVAKSPFAPKVRISAAAASAKNQNVKPAQAQSGNSSKAPQSQVVNKSKQAPAVKANSQPKPASPAVAKKQGQKEAARKQEPKEVAKKQEPKKEVAKKQEPKKEVAKKLAPKKPEAKTAPTQAKAEPKPAEAEKKTATPPEPVAQSEPVKLPSPGKRDPFLSPLVAAGARGPSNCTTGKRCLVVDQIVLKGVVQMRNGNLALVENAGKRPYVLHENDSLFNGSVVKITGDSLILREVSSDVLGRPVTREVVKKVTAPSV